MYLVRTQRCVRQQALPQMSEVSIRIARRSDSFIDLKNVNLVPGHLLIGEITQHYPRRFAAAHRHREHSTLSYRFASRSSNYSSSSSCHGIGIIEHLKIHCSSPVPD